MKYFVCRLEHDAGVSFLKTNSSSIKNLKETLMEVEKCPKSAIKAREVPISMMSFPSGQLWKLYDKPFVLKMVNRKAVKVLEYLGHSARIKYIKSGKECTVSRTIIKEYQLKK